ncbi:hypothetical protein AAVH_07675 [Aphelenchoides avenae]|nr:hypothetical protein AAVH_07675 [Aphelenchus avenae]
MSSKLMPKDLVDAVGSNVKPPATRSRRQISLLPVAAGKSPAPRMTEGNATVENDARAQRRKDAVDTASNAPERETEAAVNALLDSDVEPATPQALTMPSVKVDPQPHRGKREGRSARRNSRASRRDSSSESDHTPEPPKRDHASKRPRRRLWIPTG